MEQFVDSSVSEFNSKRVAFGRHETFGLRYGWLTKGYQALLKNDKVFESDDSVVVLGVGRNMVHSIRYWLQATRIVKRTTEGLKPTPIGEAIFGEDGWDPYLEDEATIWLIHWLLTTNPDLATAWYWFFNCFHKPEFSSQEMSRALEDFAKGQIEAKTSASTLKGDAALILRMYVSSKSNTRIPLEEALDSPLSLLRLITQLPGNRRYQSKPEIRDGLPLGVLGFAVAEIFQILNVTELPIEELMYGKEKFPAVGSVFRLTENDLLAKLERLVHYIPGSFELRETAGIHQMYKLENIQPKRYLEKHYRDMEKEAAA